MTAEKFCLKWNDFESNISVAFRDIRDQSEFFDVTLACEDNQIDAHKVILSACSPFFRGVLKRNPHQHPLLYLKGIKFADLESVLNFMYHGEVNVAQDQLNSFLQVAEDLRVKGLTQNKNGEKSHERVSPSTAIKSRAPDRDQGGPAPKRPRPSLPPPPTEQDDDDDIQEVVPVKSEPRDVVPAVPPPPPAPEPDFQQALVQQDDYSIEEEYEDYDQYQDDTYQGHNQEPDKGSDQIIMGDADDLNSLARSYTEGAGQGQVRCTLCGKISSHSGNARQHFEAHHFASNQPQICPVCIKPFRTKHSLSSHMSKTHRGLKALI